MKQKRALHNKPHKTGRKGYRGKRKEWDEEEDAKLVAEGKQNPWDQFPGCLRPYLRATVGKKKKNTSECSGGITFNNHAVVGVADRVKTLAAQGSDGSFSGVREDDILIAALDTPEHRGRVRGVSSSLGWGNGFGEEFAGKYRKKRNKRSDAHDVMADRIIKSIVHALRLSGINIPKNALLPSKLPCLSVAARKKILMALRKKMGMTARKNMHMTARKMAESEIIGMPTVTKRMKCAVIVDHRVQPFGWHLLMDKRRIPLRSASVRTPHLFHHGIPKVLVNPRSKGFTSVRSTTTLAHGSTILEHAIA
jgi:hypothetical protein